MPNALGGPRRHGREFAGAGAEVGECSRKLAGTFGKMKRRAHGSAPHSRKGSSMSTNRNNRGVRAYPEVESRLVKSSQAAVQVMGATTDSSAKKKFSL
jgi:hypothetical protein